MYWLDIGHFTHGEANKSIVEVKQGCRWEMLRKKSIRDIYWPRVHEFYLYVLTLVSCIV